MTTTNRDITTPPKLSKEIQTLLDEYRTLQEEMEAHQAELSRLQSRQYAIKGEIAALEIPAAESGDGGEQRKDRAPRGTETVL